MNVKIINFLFTKIAAFAFVLSIWNFSYETFSFTNQHNGRRIRQNGILLGAGTRRLLFGECNVVKETDDIFLKGRTVKILKKDSNEISSRLDALIKDENFRNQSKFWTHYNHAQRTPNALMRDDRSQSVLSLSSFGENFKIPLYELKRSISEDSIFPDSGVYNSFQSINHISNDSLDSCGLGVLKNEKCLTMIDAISEQKEFEKLIQEHRFKKIIEPGIYGFLKKIDRKVESEMLNIMKGDFGYDNNKADRAICKNRYKKLLKYIKKYRIFLPLIVFGAIAIVLMPYVLFCNILIFTTTSSFSLFHLYMVSLASSFFLSIYYQNKYEKCSKIIGRFLKYRKDPSLKKKIPPAIYFS
ncbi:Plasmodium exported protein, unknown function [Plasmodium knowlesi strain H]|uniref:Pv-fam-d protein n=3 Tax=Plasmodium knowlesi TaxID=5850 RepID=A0A1A7VV52_PLAKH|nr:Plasmodium exported protein, unknown function [Plasmodium knowlesi strain H]OTN66651.1 Uncharacterized protein PKNOH_S08472400 [Plasmodium knowlesi]CAA9990049.1 Plasmodium exported protein, unknown function [Plasmodium knowlesi strain H]SBO25706.1 Plasmodium exported protein, unknown function [Plasmodium knowlesi strain H]SBO28521.1 Plasmodium exported protein, unknown function [Plasmodium knowlesi strain H]VVS79523.1 Plasmodium exported protein, unknown function [Plasmodium knowlesi strain